MTAGYNPILAARRVSKTFEQGATTVPVLVEVDFALSKGEIVAIEGPSGSGKTTLLSILGFIMTPTSGELFFDGRRIEIANPEILPAIRRRHIGFVFQQFNLFTALSVRENVEFALNIRGIVGRPAREEARRTVDAVGMSHAMDWLPRTLSGGEKQRVAIARAIAGRSDVVLADEPTANLDGATGESVLDLFRRVVREEGRSLVIVTHDPKVRKVVDRVCRIHDGILENGGSAHV
jgi:putative ABC transport system ATP-binding protein